MNGLAGYLERVLALLLKLQPIIEEYDVLWAGPYYIPRSGDWHPSTFTLYRGQLFASLRMGLRWHRLSWRIGSELVEVERGLSMPAVDLGQQQWRQALEQIERRLLAATRNAGAYNRRAQRYLPSSCRTGKVRRSLCWPQSARRPVSMRKLGKLDGAMTRTTRPDSLKDMTLARYLRVAGIAYDAVFKDLHGLSARQKYMRRADGRHGGMLDLPLHDTQAFARWFTNRRWEGMHPWEIVFGHPHGILMSPDCESATKRWSYSLSVDSEGWYATAVRMALGLAEAGVPFEFHDWKKVRSALAGIDLVEVGPGFMQVGYDELRRTRPDALSAIRWDPIPAVALITADQMARAVAQLRTTD